MTTSIWKQTDEAFKAAGLVRRVQFEIGHIRLVEKFVPRGMAVGLVPERIAQGIQGLPLLAFSQACSGNRFDQAAKPPSALRLAPVMYPASGPAR